MEIVPKNPRIFGNRFRFIFYDTGAQLGSQTFMTEDIDFDAQKAQKNSPFINSLIQRMLYFPKRFTFLLFGSWVKLIPSSNANFAIYCIQRQMEFSEVAQRKIRFSSNFSWRLFFFLNSSKVCLTLGPHGTGCVRLFR